jgi:uncharacterized protein (TIGR00369 family)
MSDSNSIAARLLKEPYARWIGLGGARFDAATAHLELPYKDSNSNPGRQVHGGVVASAMIAAAQLAALAGAETAEPCAAGSVSANVGFLASSVGEPIVADARVLRRGKELCYLHCEAANAQRKPLAIATVIYRVAPGADAPPYPAPADRSRDESGEVAQLGGMLVATPFIAGVGIIAEQMRAGAARLRLPFRAEIADRNGAVHDGAIAALLDTCGSLAAWSLVTPKRGVRASTVGIDINFIGAAVGAELIARSRTVGRRREIFFNHVEIETGAGVRVADGTVLYRIVLPAEEGS